MTLRVDREVAVRELAARVGWDVVAEILYGDDAERGTTDSLISSRRGCSASRLRELLAAVVECDQELLDELAERYADESS